MGFYNRLSQKNKLLILMFPILILIVVVLVVVLRRPSIQSSLDKTTVEFTGYNGSGRASIVTKSKSEQENAFNLIKAIALTEAKSANIDSDKVINILNATKDHNLSSLSGLTDSDNYSGISANDAPKYQQFIDHMENTQIYFDGLNSIKNGDRVKLVIEDRSNVSFLKKKYVSKEFKVTGLKNSKKTTLSSKDFTVKTSGTNGYGNVSIKYGNVSIFNDKDNVTRKFSNGDTISIKRSKISKKLNSDDHKYTTNTSKITFKINGLPNSKIHLSGLDSILNGVPGVPGGQVVYKAFLVTGKDGYYKDASRIVLYTKLAQDDGKNTVYEKYILESKGQLSQTGYGYSIKNNTIIPYDTGLAASSYGNIVGTSGVDDDYQSYLRPGQYIYDLK